MAKRGSSTPKRLPTPAKSASATDEVAEALHQFAETLPVRVVQCRGDEPAAAQRDRDADVHGLLPEAMPERDPRQVGLVMLAGLFGFFLLERFLRLPHAHGHAGESHGHAERNHGPHPAGALILVGDAFHNFVDGVVIATAYWANFLSSLTTFAGALRAYFALGFIAPRIPFFLTLSAASFLYVGMVDLAPILHHDSGLRKSLQQLAGLLAGAGTILLLHTAME